jgi:hypothetical protein
VLSEINSLNESYSAALPSLDLAQSYYEKAMELSDIPDNAGCEEAIAYLDQSIELNPSYPGFYYQKASILFQFLGFYKTFHSSGIDTMFQNLDIAIELDPDFSDKYCPKGIAYYLRGLVGSIHPRADREMLEKAIADLEIADGLGLKAKEYLEFAKERLQLFSPDEKFFVDEYEKKDVQTTKELELEHSNLTADLEKNLKNEDFAKATEVLTQLIDLTEKLMKVDSYYNLRDLSQHYMQRAYCSILAGQLEKGLTDLDWVESHWNPEIQRDAKIVEEMAVLSVPMELIKGLANRLHGSEENALGYFQSAANRGDLLALLILNQQENALPPSPEILILPPAQRIERLVIERHYEAALNEISLHSNEFSPYHADKYKLIAYKAVCCALRGNTAEAIEELNRLIHGIDGVAFSNFNLHLAVIYAHADQKESALKIFDETENFLWDQITQGHHRLLRELIRQSKI